MKYTFLIISFALLASCSNDGLSSDLNKLLEEDYYLGLPGSRLFYRTTTKETQEKYHYSECKKKISSGDKLRIESCVSSYWLKAKNI